MLTLSLDTYFILHSAHMQTLCIRVVYILSDRCCKLLIPRKSHGLNLKSLNISNCCSMQYSPVVKMSHSFTETNKHLTFLIKPQVSTWFFYWFFHCFCTWQQCSWKKRKEIKPKVFFKVLHFLLFYIPATLQWPVWGWKGSIWRLAWRKNYSSL